MSASSTFTALAVLRRPFLGLRASYDLLLSMAFALALPLLLLLPPWLTLLRVPPGLAGALFVPGYVLTSALFPRRDDLDLPARLGLSLGLSLALLPFLALLLDRLPWGIRPWPIAISLMVWIIGVAAVALLRRQRAGPEAMRLPPPGAPVWWRTASPRRQLAYLGAALGVAAVLGIGFAAVLTPLPPPTEFYVLGRQGLAEDYPRAAVAGEPVQVTIGIINNERIARTYRLEVWAGDGWTEADRERVLLEPPLTLGPGERLERTLVWAMPRAGIDQRVDILLLRDGEADAHRRLRLWLNVTPPRL